MPPRTSGPTLRAARAAAGRGVDGAASGPNSLAASCCTSPTVRRRPHRPAASAASSAVQPRDAAQARAHTLLAERPTQDPSPWDPPRDSPHGDPPMAASPDVWLLALAAGAPDCIDGPTGRPPPAPVQRPPRMRGEGAQPADESSSERALGGTLPPAAPSCVP